MKGILNKTNRGWVITYDEVIVKKNSAIPIGKIAFISKLYDSNEGLEVEFEMVDGYDNNGPEI